MKKTYTPFLFLFSLLYFLAPFKAKANAVNIGVAASAPYGPELSFRYQLLPRTFLNISGSRLSLNAEGKISEADVEARLTISRLALGLDFHPFYNGIFLGMGAASTDINLKAHTPNKAFTIDINHVSYTLPAGNTLDSKLYWDKVVPYFRLGYRTMVGSFGFIFSLGAQYIGKPHINTQLRGDFKNIKVPSGTAMLPGDFQKIVDANINNLNEEALKDIKDLPGQGRILPTLTIGLSFSF